MIRRVLIVLAFLAGLGACADPVAPPPPCVIWNVQEGATVYYPTCPVAAK